MLKRLIGVITVRDNWAVQSIGYKKYLPLGRPEVIAENFDRWQLDEILIVDITRSKHNKGPNFKMLEKIATKKIMTPLCYTGGIRGKYDAINLISCGADRLGIDSLFRHNQDEAHSISDAIVKIEKDQNLKDKMIVEGHRHAQKFIDETIAINLMKIYSSL